MKQNALIRLTVIALALFFAAVFAQTAFAQWSNNPNVNTAVVTQSANQYSPQVCSDGAGGTFVVWADYRNGDGDIYAQHLNAAGVPQWAMDGVSICAGSTGQWGPQLIGDGAGGAIITWYDNLGDNNLGIYAQRVNSAGVRQWGIGGVPISTFYFNYRFAGPVHQIVTDGAGGAIVVWNAGFYSVYAQRVNSSGVLQWTTNGVWINTDGGMQYNPRLVADGSAGAIITWVDSRGIYAQRLNSSGIVQWTNNGVAIRTGAHSYANTSLNSDGVGGAIITWADYYSSNYDIYAQRVNSSGVVQWITNGIAICTATSDQVNPQLISDGSGGGIIAWSDNRGGTGDIYAQRVNSSGALQWLSDGVAICTAPNYQGHPALIGDGSGGAIIAWDDNRIATAVDIYAQRVNSSGVSQWSTNGGAICTAPNNQDNPLIASDGSGGAIITWQDYRSGTNYDIYAQNVNRYGQLGITAPSVIANGQFEQGTTNWTMYSAVPNGMNFSSVPSGPSGAYAKVHINATSNNMQVYQTYFPLTAGKRYTLGFDAYSPTSRKVFVTVHKHNAPYGSYGFGEWIQLGPNWTHYERQFTAAGFSGTTSDTRLRFYFVYACGAGDDYYFDNVSLAQVLAKSGEEQIAEQPTSFVLEQNYPNPFNPTTTIRFQIPNDDHVSLKIYDVLGREVAALVDESRAAGIYQTDFDATNLSSGVYFYRLEHGKNISVKKFILQK